MPSSQYIPFAVDPSANTLTFSTYQSSPLVAIGHTPGVALSEVVNTTFRQTSVGVAGLAKFIADYQLANVLDNGDHEGFAAQLKAAIDTVINSQQFWRPGDLKMCASDVVDAGWIKANGAIYDRTAYPALFDRIGTRWNVTPGISGTQFQVPDFRGVVPRGWDEGRGLDPSRVLGGAVQMDAFQEWVGYLGIDDKSTQTGRGIVKTLPVQDVRDAAVNFGAPVIDTTSQGGDGNYYYAEFKPSNQTGVRTATETRMKNNSCMFVIKT